MPAQKNETFNLRTHSDIIIVRQATRAWAVELAFSIVDQTKIVTASSELARNTIDHGLGGTVLLELLHEGIRRGLRLTFEDQGPGIPDIDRVLKGGYTTAGGLGLGLSGSKRLVSEFDLVSTVGIGTRITITKWK